MKQLWWRLGADGKTPEPCDVVAFENIDRRVARDKVGDVTISTVFLGLDHSFDESGPPILFETMVFGGPLDEEQVRYATWDEAVAGHAAMVQRVKEAGK